MIWIFAGLLALVAAVLAIAYGCFRMAFYAGNRGNWDPEIIETPEGEIYDPYREDMEKWIREARAMPQESFAIRSFDGLTLRGKYFEYAPGAPIELMIHGYRGTAERDLSGGVQRCFKLGRSAFLVDQRASGSSEGSVITFGIREHKDCLAWVDFMVKHFGPDVKIILTGISMGAATVMMAAGNPLPENVIGVLADCGFDSPRNIIREVIRQMGLPVGISYPFVKLGARLFGGFDLEETSPVEAMRRCRVPVIFFHGDADDYVPCEMSKRCFDACASRKRLEIVHGAGHGLSYPVAGEDYRVAVREFFGPEASIDIPSAP